MRVYDIWDYVGFAVEAFVFIGQIACLAGLVYLFKWLPKSGE